MIIIKYTGDISNPGKQQKENEQKSAANSRDVTIVLDENMESIICSILKEDEELGLEIYKQTDEYMRKLEVISDALITGFNMIQQCFTEERIRQGKESALKRSELKASFKLVPRKTD